MNKAGASKPKASVIIVTYNDGDNLLNCVASLLETCEDGLELIIIDQGSTDEITKIALRFALIYNKETKVIKLPYNVGVSLGRNLGAVAASSDVLYFIDSDAEVCEGWLEPVLYALADGRVGICQSAVHDGMMGQGHAIIHVIDVYGGVLELNGVDCREDFCRIPYATGGGMAIRKEVFMEVGMFDPYFFFGYEEADLAFRIWRSSYSVVLVPESKVIHGRRWRERKSLQDYSRYFYMVRGRLAFMLKNYRLANLIRYFFPLIMFFLVASLRDLIIGRLEVGLARLLAMYHLFKNLRYVIRQRALVKRTGVVEGDVVDLGLVTNYYTLALRLAKYIREIAGG